jgi:hypothetical protein
MLLVSRLMIARSLKLLVDVSEGPEDLTGKLGRGMFEEEVVWARPTYIGDRKMGSWHSLGVS